MYGGPVSKSYVHIQVLEGSWDLMATYGWSQILTCAGSQILRGQISGGAAVEVIQSPVLSSDQVPCTSCEVLVPSPLKRWSPGEAARCRTPQPAPRDGRPPTTLLSIECLTSTSAKRKIEALVVGVRFRGKFNGNYNEKQKGVVCIVT